jgi:hypothetical protein
MAMTKIRIFDGEFSGEMLFNGRFIVKFWALRNERGLQASFEQPEGKPSISDMELFKALEAIVNGD